MFSSKIHLKSLKFINILWASNKVIILKQHKETNQLFISKYLKHPASNKQSNCRALNRSFGKPAPKYLGSTKAFVSEGAENALRAPTGSYRVEEAWKEPEELHAFHRVLDMFDVDGVQRLSKWDYSDSWQPRKNLFYTRKISHPLGTLKKKGTHMFAMQSAAVWDSCTVIGQGLSSLTKSNASSAKHLFTNSFWSSGIESLVLSA